MDPPKIYISQAQRRYFVLQCCIGAAVLNLLLNAAAGWVVTLKVLEFPVWKFPGVMADLAGTAFGITFGTAAVAPFATRRDLVRGKITAPTVAPHIDASFERLPQSTLRRAAWFGVLSVALFVTPIAVALVALGADALGRTAFIVLKAVFSGLQAAIVTPFIVFAVLLDEARRRRQAAF